MRTFLFHCSALVLVVAYVHTFILWREIGNAFGRDIRNGVPLTLAAVLAIAIAVYIGVNLRRGKLSIDWRWIIAAVVIAIIGLASTDPVFPAKRIHVPQYVILAIILSFAVRTSHRTSLTLFLVFLAAVAYGVHDEFLQGLHPRRSYGVRDMFVNACGAGAGTLLVRALTPAPDRTDASSPVPMALVAALFVLASGVAMFAIAATAYQADILPYWTVLPALAGALILAVVAEGLPAPGDRLALRAIVGVCVLYAAYPLVINIAFPEFA